MAAAAPHQKTPAEYEKIIETMQAAHKKEMEEAASGHQEEMEKAEHERTRLLEICGGTVLAATIRLRNAHHWSVRHCPHCNDAGFKETMKHKQKHKHGGGRSLTIHKPHLHQASIPSTNDGQEADTGGALGPAPHMVRSSRSATDPIGFLTAREGGHADCSGLDWLEWEDMMSKPYAAVFCGRVMEMYLALGLMNEHEQRHCNQKPSA